MDFKKIILEIIKDNYPIGRDKFDRLYYSKVDYNNSWVPIVEELRHDGLLEKKELKITKKGIDYLEI